MIKIGGFYILKDPRDLRKDHKLLASAKHNESIDKDFFIIPEKIWSVEIKNLRQHQILNVYKVGFLKEYLTEVYPDYDSNSIYKLISQKYQVFMSIRNMQEHYTKWKKYSHNFF